MCRVCQQRNIKRISMMNKQNVKSKIYIIGGSVIDVLLCPVDASIFSCPSTSIDAIPMLAGGDAMNEASVLACLGASVSLITLVGLDAAGQFLLTCGQDFGIDMSHVVVSETIPTSVNVVLVDGQAERRFVTAKNTSLRMLDAQMVRSELDDLERGGIVCLASLFVSPKLDHGEVSRIFRELKRRGCMVCADMTRRKNGETAASMKDFFKHIDYLFCNLEEGALLTGKTEPEAIADVLFEQGAKHVLVKLGAQGCYIKSNILTRYFKAYHNSKVLDTTGAGDTFAGAFIHALSQNTSLDDCIRFANAAASICVENRGCSPRNLQMSEILSRMNDI